MRKALVVGINNYPKAELFGCVNDASAFGNVSYPFLGHGLANLFET